MAVDIIMPRLGLTMEEGTIVRWHAAEGDRVAQGQVLLDVETDKVTVEVEAPATGVMGSVLVNEGQKVPVGTLLGRIAAEDEILRSAQNDSVRQQIDNEAGQNDSTHRGKPATPPQPRISPLARRMAEQAGVDVTSLAPDGPGGRITAGDVQAALVSHPTPGPEPASAAGRARIFSSPRARRQARALGVDWRASPGSGPRARDRTRRAEQRGRISFNPTSLGRWKCSWETPTRSATHRSRADDGELRERTALLP